MKKSSLVKNTLLLSVGTLLNKGLTFLMIPFFSSWLTTEEYGIFDLIGTYVTLFIPLIGLSLSEALFRFSLDTNIESKKSQYISTSFFIYTFNLLIISLVSIVLYLTNIWKLSILCCFLLIGEVYSSYFNSYLRSIKRLNFYSFTSIISTIFIAVFTTIFIKYFHFNLEGIILGYSLGYFAGNIIIILYTRFWTKLSLKNIKMDVAKRMLKYSYVLIPNSISWWIINVSDRSIINLFLGATFNGIYAIASKVPNFCTSLFSVFSFSWQESAIDMLHDKDRNIYYNNVYNKMFVILISLCCFVLSLQFILFGYVFDMKYYNSHFYTPILILSAIFSTVSIFFGGIQISLKNPKANGMTTIVGAISNIIIHLILIQFIGLYAAALSTLLSQIIVFSLRKYLIQKKIRLTIWSKNYYYLVYLFYLSICAYNYDKIGVSINILNLFISMLILLLVTKKYIIMILRKVKVINS